MMNMEDIEQTNNEEIIDVEETEATQENTRKTLEEIKEEVAKREISKLYKQLQELQEKLEKEELSPMQRFLVENKLAIVETRLERQLAKLDIKDLKKKYEEIKDGEYEIHNEELQEKQAELDSIFEEIEKQERIIEKKVSNMKKRNVDYKEINNVGKTTIPRKNARDTYQFKTTGKLNDIVQEQQKKLDELKAKKDLKKDEIINFRKEFIENEKTSEAEFSQYLKEYKPSVWQSFKTAFKKISDNFVSWRKNSKEEKEAVRDAKVQARKNARTGKNVDSVAENTVKMEVFKDRVNSHISLEEQRTYSEKVQEEQKEQIEQEEIEKVEGEVIE